MTKRLIAYLHVGFCGMDNYEAFIMPDDATQDEIDQEVWYMALNNAEAYGYYPRSDDDPDDDYDEAWNSDNVSDGIEGSATPYNGDDHDMHRSGGGSFEEDFAHLEQH